MLKDFSTQMSITDHPLGRSATVVNKGPCPVNTEESGNPKTIVRRGASWSYAELGFTLRVSLRRGAVLLGGPGSSTSLPTVPQCGPPAVEGGVGMTCGCALYP